jgi:hypothetical protein
MTDLQAEIRAAADEMVATPAETGLQVAVHRYGQVVADVTAGVANPRTGEDQVPVLLAIAQPADGFRAGSGSTGQPWD